MTVKGVLIDWAGVLTTSMAESINTWLVTDRIDAGHYTGVMREMIATAYGGEGVENPIHTLERGEITALAFETALAAELRTHDGVAPIAEGLLTRMFAGFLPVEAMFEMLRRAREAGYKTCLVSNSWGNEYDRTGWEDAFDAVVISGEVGMRKPEPRIFAHAVGLVGLEPAECVFIDDIEANIVAARELGFTGILHTHADTTITELETLLKVPLRPA
ncbi:HAD family hydrolase [Herbidospora mongoliensis]|uniref:HAD family hydrolase n=1 Tax=Herbidospora mongoliensis TaxID=688067 RepID=UPI000833D7AA|nr:HAD family phosphatase [Herbidospora mongoliensis]